MPKLQQFGIGRVEVYVGTAKEEDAKADSMLFEGLTVIGDDSSASISSSFSVS